MPELPEVETVRRELEPLVVGQSIARADVRWERTCAGLDSQGLTAQLAGVHLRAVQRRAKYLLFRGERAGAPCDFSVHLRMTGRLTVREASAACDPYLRVRLTFDSGLALHFDDVRKFGRLRLGTPAEVTLPALGPEPLDLSWSGRAWWERVRTRSRPLKALLLDQSLVAGVGNIYADEALFRAGLSPWKKGSELSLQASEDLVAAVREVLHAALAEDGASFDRFYRTPTGNPGRFQANFQVYGRTGAPCHRCATAIVRAVIGQRSTHHCPSCQQG